jgi:hypothetical protein
LQQGVLEGCGTDVGFGELVEREPVELQVVFLTDRICGIKIDLEPK